MKNDTKILEKDNEVKTNKESNNTVNVADDKEKIKDSKSNETLNKKDNNTALQKIPESKVLNYNPLDKTNHDVKAVITFIFSIVIAVILLIIICFTLYNIINPNIINGVQIKGVNVSNLTKSDAKYQIDNYISDNLPDEIKLKYNDFESTISLKQIEASFDTKAASNSAYNIGRQGNIFENDFTVISTLFSKVNIEPILRINETQLNKNLDDISTQLPDAVVQSSYYIENDQLIITSGKPGKVIDNEKTIESIKNSIQTFSCKDKPIEISVKDQDPDSIDIEKIHNEIYKDPVDAYYTKEPFTVFPSENGLDFNISLEEAKAVITSENKDEYIIPLKTIYPNVTTNMIGTEAFPDLLSSFSTNYAASNVNRTTNLRLAANKINGTVVMPGETFSYNKVVGARTISAGYKEAPIYVQGQVVDGLGGGICQITSTLYNAAVYANLDITQRTNHQFVPSYVTASRDATVVYGALDFQFVNNRKYPIKIQCSVSGGVANFQIFGLKQDDDYEVEISSYITGRTSTAIYSEAYKILKRDGVEVSRVLLSKDVYKRH